MNGVGGAGPRKPMSKARNYSAFWIELVFGMCHGAALPPISTGRRDFTTPQPYTFNA
jgi:hypothetical protein